MSYYIDDLGTFIAHAMIGGENIGRRFIWIKIFDQIVDLVHTLVHDLDIINIAKVQ
jgi:hypothetical protein